MNGTQNGGWAARGLVERPTRELDGEGLLVLLREYVAAVARSENPEPLSAEVIDMAADGLAQTFADVAYLMSEVECWRQVALQGGKTLTRDAENAARNGADHS